MPSRPELASRTSAPSSPSASPERPPNLDLVIDDEHREAATEFQITEQEEAQLHRGDDYNYAYNIDHDPIPHHLLQWM